MSSRRVCLAIGVSDVTPGPGAETRFAYLDGAPLAADAIGQWALSSGFGAGNVRVVTDQRLPQGGANPVTKERVQDAANQLFPVGGPPTDHLILTFCGHGLTADFGTVFWLFSDSLEQRYRVNVEAFIAELLGFGIKRISLISDACRDAPQGLELTRLDPHRSILGRQAPNSSPMFDRLAACQDGQKTYMVGDQSSAAPGKCILSGVVLDVLWGNEPGAFKNNVIDTHSFGSFTRNRATEKAREYGYPLHPQCTVNPDAVVLVDGAAIPEPVPPLPPWPPVAGVTSIGVATRGLSPQGTSIERLRSDKGFRDAMLGHDFGTSHPDLDASSGFTALPDNDDARSLVHHLVALRRDGTASAQVDADISSTISTLEGLAAREARAAAAGMLGASLRDAHVPGNIDNVHLVVRGGSVRHIWSERRVAGRHIAGNEAQFSISDLLAAGGAQIVVEFADDVFVPVYLYPSLCAVVVRNPNGAAAIAYAASDREVLDQSALAIEELARGTLDSTSIESIAAKIRYGKHANPVLGAIAAYLYRQVADVDNLRRMAYYYVDHKQPIPFDIALLGQMDVYAEGGIYFVRVPGVPPRQGQSGERNPLPNYATVETPAVTGPLAGRCPWLTLGWDYRRGESFGDTVYEKFRLDGGLSRLSSFTSLTRDLAERLVFAWKLKPW